MRDARCLRHRGAHRIFLAQVLASGRLLWRTFADNETVWSETEIDENNIHCADCIWVVTHRYQQLALLPIELSPP